MNKCLRHAWNDPITGWNFEMLDGTGGLPSTRVNANVGFNPSVMLTTPTTIDLTYYDARGLLRHAWGG
jgi:hypothetical protein